MVKTRQQYATMAELFVVLCDWESTTCSMVFARTRLQASSATSSSSSASTSPSTECSSTRSTLSTRYWSTRTGTATPRHDVTKHTKIEAFQQTQARFNSEMEQYTALHGVIIVRPPHSGMSARR